MTLTTYMELPVRFNNSWLKGLMTLSKVDFKKFNICAQVPWLYLSLPVAPINIIGSTQQNIWTMPCHVNLHYECSKLRKTFALNHAPCVHGSVQQKNGTVCFPIWLLTGSLGCRAGIYVFNILWVFLFLPYNVSDVIRHDGQLIWSTLFIPYLSWFELEPAHSLVVYRICICVF